MTELSQQERLDRRPHVAPDLPEERLAEGWHQVRERRPDSRMKFAGGALALTAAAITVMAVWSLGTENGINPGETRVSTAGESADIELANGSQIEVEPHTVLSLEQDTAEQTLISLDHGGARFDIVHVEAHDVVVAAGAVRVRVVGTRFSVHRQHRSGSDYVEVEVERGIVEVESGGRTRRLEAGMRWSTQEQLTEAATPSPAPTDDTAALPEDSAPADQTALVAPAPQSPRAVTPGDSQSPRESPGALLERAAAARRAGAPRRAAAHYASLVRMHPRDTRAGLAAFELGRLRLDLLHDPRGAARAFRTALRIAPRSPFREDAMARLVQAHQAAGQRAACANARDQYIRSYPNGRHLSDVRRRCE